MARRTLPSEDIWQNVEDAKKRKQIQDRLAQRARRQRLRETRNNAKQPNGKDETPLREGGDAQHQPPTPTETSTINQGSIHLPEQISDIELLPPHMDITMGSCPIFKNLEDNIGPSTTSGESMEPVGFINVEMQNEVSCKVANSSLQRLFPSPSGQPNIGLTLPKALYINGQLLGLSCSVVVPSVSAPAGPHIPTSLRPTEIQLRTVHLPWIDRFPFPKMRDLTISLSGVIDYEELIKDVLLMQSFNFVPGLPAWDPSAWKIEEPFAIKWGHLFFQ